MVAVCEEAEGRGSFIACSSTRNQALDGYLQMYLPCILLHIFRDGTSWAFGCRKSHPHIHVADVYLRITNCALSEWMITLNDHPVQTEHSWSPNQMSGGME